jgi:hypothetical protein
MDEKEFSELTKRFQAAKPGDPKVTMPPGADAEDITEYLRLAKNGKQLLAKANAAANGAVASRIHLYLAELKRVARARAMQRELARLEKSEKAFVTPFPELDPNLQSSRFGR